MFSLRYHTSLNHKKMRDECGFYIDGNNVPYLNTVISFEGDIVIKHSLT